MLSAALEMIRQIMEKLKLTLHPAETRLVDLGREGFEFLEFHFHTRTDRRTRKVLPHFWPGQKSMKTLRSKIHQLTGYSRKRVPMAKIVNDLNLVIRGWRNYFSVGNLPPWRTATHEKSQTDYKPFAFSKDSASFQSSRLRHFRGPSSGITVPCRF